jgi:hypothetical protein
MGCVLLLVRNLQVTVGRLALTTRRPRDTTRLMRSPSELAGLAVGALTSPVFAVGSALRGARVFHPDGHAFSARCEPATNDASLAPLAQRLAGDAIIRLSGGVWRNDREWPDVLGCAVRFRQNRSFDAAPAPGDQDLVFATLRSIFTLPFAFATTNTRDYLCNDYFGAAPYFADEAGKLALRLTPLATGEGTRRAERLDDALRRGIAAFRLEHRPSHRPWSAWRPLATLTLREPLSFGDGELCFSPFQTGAGLRPVGFVHATRRVPYLVSQLARARRQR